jgi:hypothetical protein
MFKWNTVLVKHTIKTRFPNRKRNIEHVKTIRQLRKVNLKFTELYYLTFNTAILDGVNI